MTDKHPCPVPGCPQIIPSRLSMCTHHWGKLPRSMKLYVSKARDSGDEFYPEYLKAAVEVVTGRLVK